MRRASRDQLRESAHAFAEVFRNPNLRRVEVSWAGTVCTYWIFIVALGLYAYDRGGAAAVGLVGLLRVLPSVVAALASVMGLLQSTFRPTQSALLPSLVRRPEELTAANLVLTTIESVGIFVGPAIGGILLAVAGTDTIFAIAAACFLASALLLV